MTELAAADGYKSVTVRKLTKLAGVSTATFYSQFDGTDDCILATYATLMDRTGRHVAAARSTDCERHEQLARSLRALLTVFTSDPDAAHLALLEVFDGGPAALASVQAHETCLEAELKASLDRRDDRVSSTAVAWIAAGVLHHSRKQIAARHRRDARALSETMVHWGEKLIDHRESDFFTRTERSRRPPAPPRQPIEVPDLRPADEREMILAVTTKLAIAEGYWRLSESRVSEAAGIPKTRFRNKFLSVEDAYLTAVRRTSRTLFRHLAAGDKPEGPWQDVLRQQILQLSKEAAAAPETARLALSGILEPGLRGLTLRDSLIAELAAAWVATVPPAYRPDRITAEATFASLWTAVARAINLGKADCLPATSSTFADLFSVSVSRLPRPSPGVGGARRESAKLRPFDPSVASIQGGVSVPPERQPS
jgi:AcrR family transcriptional regulator